MAPPCCRLSACNWGPLSSNCAVAHASCLARCDAATLLCAPWHGSQLTLTRGVPADTACFTYQPLLLGIQQSQLVSATTTTTNTATDARHQLTVCLQPQLRVCTQQHEPAKNTARIRANNPQGDACAEVQQGRRPSRHNQRRPRNDGRGRLRQSSSPPVAMELPLSAGCRHSAPRRPMTRMAPTPVLTHIMWAKLRQCSAAGRLLWSRSPPAPCSDHSPAPLRPA